MPTPFPKEFRDDVVHVTLNRDAGVTLAQIARDFGIHVGTLDKWMRQARTEADEQSGVTTSAHDELKELRKRNRLLEEGNEVLRRAAAYLSQANLPGKGSTRCET
ncbi:MAG TPA: transposase [Enteractinococcus helveticum]|uniref:Transposase n=1 Tax=Enteractinococcus helveticum TaxID=1837282 RepID=A0A921FM67_9MICC|nr:transposase [Enteractinococcus helveticum]HJF14614.1 transposase [Enteractinococcus helveticum]